MDALEDMDAVAASDLDKDLGCECDCDCNCDVAVARLKAVVGRLMLLASAGFWRCRFRGSITDDGRAEKWP